MPRLSFPVWSATLQTASERSEVADRCQLAVGNAMCRDPQLVTSDGTHSRRLTHPTEKCLNMCSVWMAVSGTRCRLELIADRHGRVSPFHTAYFPSNSEETRLHRFPPVSRANPRFQRATSARTGTTRWAQRVRMKEDLMRVACLLLVGLLVCENSVLAAEATPITGTEQVQKQEAAQAAKTKAKMQKRGTGEKSQVRVRLVDGAEVKGYVSKIEESSFNVTNKRTGQTTTVPYANVQKIQGPGTSKGAKSPLVAVGVAVVVLVAIGVAVSHAD